MTSGTESGEQEVNSPRQESTCNVKENGLRKETWVAILLVVCVALAAFWEIMSFRSSRPLRPFSLTSADFDNFRPAVGDCSVQRLPVNPDPVEPNILTLRIAPTSPGSDTPTLPCGSLIVRLVHGYNMPDCMRIKHYNVELIGDTRRTDLDTPLRPNADKPSPSGSRSFPVPSYQAWRLTSRYGEVSIWVSTMLRAEDFTATDVDTRSMAFPKVGIPDNPGWFPRGLSFASLRHPIRNMRLFLRAKWNSSRCDPLTFLGLRQASWASDELLTLVSASSGPSVPEGDETAALNKVLAVHRLVYAELLNWRSASQ